MNRTVITNAKIVLEGTIVENWSVEVVDGSIAGVSPATESGRKSEVVDLGGIFLLPGFIDVHIHGAVGFDVNSATPGEMLEIAAFLARNGVTAWMPTLVPDTDENYRTIIESIDELIKLQDGRAVAQAIGVHYEGIFANEKMCGALRPQFFKKFTGSELDALPRLRSGRHMMTFAPEIEGGIDLAGRLVRSGWTASIGHTRADVEILDAVNKLGVRHMTHFFNAMTGIHHRDIGAAGWGLARPDVTFDLIADGIHVHPAMVQFACRGKTPDNVTLISDSVAPTGLKDGEFELWGERISVKQGRTRNERGSIAGSVITLHDAFKNMLALGFSIVELAKMLSANPAKLIGQDSLRGTIISGKRADLVGIGDDGSIEFMMIGGKILGLDQA